MDATTPTGNAGGRPVRKLVDGPGFNHLIEGRQGYLLFNANDRYIGRCLAEYGEWSPGETDLSPSPAWPGRRVRTVIDINLPTSVRHSPYFPDRQHLGHGKVIPVSILRCSPSSGARPTSGASRWPPSPARLTMNDPGTDCRSCGWTT